MSNETKIGILAFLGLALLIWGYRFLKGENILSSAKTYQVEYDDVDYLEPSSPVIMNGFQVGVVRNMFLKDGNINRIVVDLILDLEIDLPENTVAVIVDQSVMGGKAINLRTDIPCNNKFPCPEKENYLRGYSQSFLQSVLGTKEEFDTYLNDLSGGISKVVDSLKQSLGITGGGESKEFNALFEDLKATMHNLNVATGSMKAMLGNSSKSMTELVENMAAITGNLAAANKDITTMLSNMATFSEQLPEMELQSTMTEVKSAVTELKGTLSNTKEVFGRVENLLAKVEEGNGGSLGMLMGDDGALYANINSLGQSIDSLTTDMRLHPYYYLPMKTVKGVERKRKKVAKMGK